MKKQFIVGLHILLILFSSCKSVQVREAYKRDIPNTIKFIEESYDFKVNQNPSKAEAVLKLEFYKTASYTQEQEEVRSEFYDRENPRLFWGVTLLLGVGVGLAVGTDTEMDDGTIKAGDPELGWTIAIPSLIVGGFGVLVSRDKLKEKKVVKIEDRTYEQTEDTAEKAIQLSVEGTNLQTTITADENGRIALNLLTDLEADYFENKESINIDFKIEDRTVHHFSTTINLYNYLEKVLLVESNSVCARLAPSMNAAVIQGLGKGSRLEALSLDNGWYEVSVNNTKAYIHSDDVTYYYTPKVVNDFIPADCESEENRIRSGAISLIASYYNYLDNLSSSYIGKKEKRIIEKKLEQLVVDKLLLPNDLDLSDGDRVKYRKLDDYVNYISGAFLSCNISYNAKKVEIDQGAKKVSVLLKRLMTGEHAQFGAFDNNKLLTFEISYNVDAQEKAYNFKLTAVNE